MKILIQNKIIVVFVIFSSLLSCNQVEETIMDDFIVVEIDNINLTSESIVLKFKEGNNGVLFASINEADFVDFENIASRVKVNQKLKIKGIIHDFNYKQKVLPQKYDSMPSSIISVKEVRFVE
jgi:hypothetical protein